MKYFHDAGIKMHLKTSPIVASLATFVFFLLAPPAGAETLSLQEPKKTGVALHDGKSRQLHAATEKGLSASRDNGRTWVLSYPFQLPATMVAATPDGSLYAFVAGKGSLRIRGEEPLWSPVSNNLGSQVLAQLSGASGDPARLLGMNQCGR